MNPVPHKPTIKRPPGTPPPAALNVPRPGMWKRPGSCGKSLLGSLGFHLCAVLIACAFALTHLGEGTGGDIGSTPDDAGFQFDSSSWSPPEHRMKRPELSHLAVVRRPFTAVPGLTSPVSIPPSDPMQLVTTDLSIPSFPSGAGSIGEVTSNPAPSKGTGSSGTSRGARSGNGRAARKKPTPDPPKLIKAPPPLYPANARAARITGKAAVLIKVRGDGSAASTSLYRSSGNGDLDRAAVAAAREWKFSPTPSLGGGETVSVVVNVTFSL